MLDCTNGKFFSLGSLRSYGLVCAACVGLATSAQAQVDLDSWSQTPPATPVANGGSGDELEGKVEVSAYSTVDIHVQNTDLAKVLQMLSIQSQRNIIVSKNVSGTVSADLYDVTFFEALDAILNSNGYGYVEEGSFIKVYTLEELRSIKEAARKLVYRRFELSYLNSTDASIFVTPLLSENGAIAINGEVASGFKPDESDGGADNWASYATMVVHDYEENILDIARLIEELDTRPQQVLVEATVMQSSLNEDNAWGIDWSILADVDFLDFGNPLSTVDNLLSGGGDSGFQPGDNNAFATRSNVGQTSRAGGLKIGVISDDISVFLRVLDEVTDTTVISRPRVLAVNRNRGQILIGRRIGYLSTTSTETSTTQTVQFLDTGTQLIFRPFVGKDGFIRMELKPSVSEGIIRDVTGSDGSTFTIPDQITQELQTNVVVKDGHTIVLGGLFREETTLTRRQVPILGDIPVIGAAFKGKEDATRRSEITFLITPSIMRDEVLIAEGDRANELVSEARFAARTGVLHWSNDRLTSNHNLKAEEAIAAGDFELALWHIDLSLHLKPNQPLVIEMRERLLGKSDRWFNGSMMRHLTDERIKTSMNSGKSPKESPSGGEPVLAKDPLLSGKTNTPASTASGSGRSGTGSAATESTPAPQATEASVIELDSVYELPVESVPAPSEPVNTTSPNTAPQQQNSALPQSAPSETTPVEIEEEASWGAATDSTDQSLNPWWADFNVSTTPQGEEVWQIAPPAPTQLSQAATGTPVQDQNADCDVDIQPDEFADQVAQQNLHFGQTLAVCTSLSPMGAVYFGPVFARYQNWFDAQSTQQSHQGIAEVPTDAEPFK